MIYRNHYKLLQRLSIMDRTVAIQTVAVARRYHIDPRRLERGMREEKKEHPWANLATARRIACNHIVQHPRAAYAVKGGKK
jgi:hypothetical protein